MGADHLNCKHFSHLFSKEVGSNPVQDEISEHKLRAEQVGFTPFQRLNLSAICCHKSKFIFRRFQKSNFFGAENGMVQS
jgi:hypothetical protein